MLDEDNDWRRRFTTQDLDERLHQPGGGEPGERGARAVLPVRHRVGGIRIAHLLTGADAEFNKISGALSACTVVGTIPSLIAALGFSVTFLSAVATLSNNFANTLEEKKAKVEQQATMDGQLANGNWPSAVADTMSDTSVRDGDKSDWTPK